MTEYGPYEAIVTKIVDGDSFYCRINLASLLKEPWDLGFGVVIPPPKVDITLECRVFGINAPELRTPEGKLAKAFAETLMSEGMPVTIVSHGWDKYGGRFDGSVFLPDGSNFGEAMVNSGHAIKKDY